MLVKNLQGNQRLQGTNECSSVGLVSVPKLYSFVKKTDCIGKINGTFIFSLSQVFENVFLALAEGTALPVNGAWLRLLETLSVHVSLGTGSHSLPKSTVIM